MAKTLCKVGGLIFLIVGLVGFATPNLMGFHSRRFTPSPLGPGLIALYLGSGLLRRSEVSVPSASYTC